MGSSLVELRRALSVKRLSVTSRVGGDALGMKGLLGVAFCANFDSSLNETQDTVLVLSGVVVL